MKSISNSKLVWDAIASRGEFWETEDDVLSREFNLPPRSAPSPIGATASRQPPSGQAKVRPRSFATDKLSSYISENELRIEFASGPASSWKLPRKNDKAAIRSVRDEAARFVESKGATNGQVNALKKTLTDSGYYVLK